MKPRYAVVNERERDEFEKEWQMPYGYANCAVFDDYEEAERFYEKVKMVEKHKPYILEEYDNGWSNIIMEG